MRLFRIGYSGAITKPATSAITPVREYAAWLSRMNLNRKISTPVVATLAMAYSR